jgi:hypothetical protein
LLQLLKGYGFRNVTDHYRRRYSFVKLPQQETYLINEFLIADEIFIRLVGMFIVVELEFNVADAS